MPSSHHDAAVALETRNVFGFPVEVSSVEEMCEALAGRALSAQTPCMVAAADVHVMTRGVHLPPYGNMLAQMDVICPDGMPVVWKLNRGLPAQARAARRISGPDLMESLVMANASHPELRHFLLGGTEELLAKLSANLRFKCPSFHLAGVHSPPFRAWTAEDMAAMRQAIADSGANIVWVGLGCPKQEEWMAEQKALLTPAVYVGVGAAFAFFAGTVPRAPLWMQKKGLEWLYRLYKEPRRLFKRYLKHNSLFLWYLVTGNKRRT